MQAARPISGSPSAAAEARSRLLAIAPRFETEFPALIEAWRFDPRLRDALQRGLYEAGLAVR